MKMQTRTAPKGAHLMFGMAGAPSRGMVEAGMRRQGVPAAVARAAGALSSEHVDEQQGGLPRPPDPTPGAAPDADTQARLDAQDAQLADHGSRIARVEGALNLQQEPTPANPPAAAARATAGAPLDARAILARHGEVRRERAAAMQGGQRRPPPPRQAPPASCATLDADDVYARLCQQRAGGGR